MFIAKLPLGSPADPLEGSRAEWLATLGRDPFAEWMVPATGVRLMQRTGRASRTEEDKATVVCYDRGLLQRGGSQRRLRRLPPYAISRCSAQTQD